MRSTASSAGAASFTYDLNGNPTSDGTNSYVYDVENRLTSATTGGVTTSLSHDEPIREGLGRYLGAVFQPR